MAQANTDEQKKLADWTLQKFKDAMMAKQNLTANWMNYLNAWDNSLYEDASNPSYKSNQISNFIFSTIESMRPIMFDSDPKFESIPVTLESVPYSSDINQVLDWEWYRTGMTKKTIANSIYTFVIGTSIFMLPYDFSSKVGEDVDGNVLPVLVNPFNLFPDPLATTVEDAEYIIYATYQHVNALKMLYPESADALTGADIQYSELVNSRNEGSRITNQVLVLEVWTRDYTTIEVEEENEGVKSTVKKSQFPLGRVITSAPDLGLILKDEPNPYQTGRFPFFLFKDIEVPFQFWGEGEVKWLLSPQDGINALSNQIIDNAKTTANMQWVIDKNAGIPVGTLTNRPGLVIRKNPGSEVRRDSPPSMPMYVAEKINSLKTDIEVISGVHDVTRGQNPSGIESGAAIVALQEAANTRIRLKAKLNEESLGEMGNEWLSRIKQFWKFNRLIPVKKEQTAANATQAMPTATATQAINPVAETPNPSPVDTSQVVQGTQSYDFITISQDKQLAQNYRVKVVGASTMATNSASMLDLMIRLIQTTAEDGMPIVNRETVLDFIPKVNKESILKHFKDKQAEQLAQQLAQQQSQSQTEQTQSILGDMTTQMQGMNTDLGSVQDRFAKQDQDTANENIKAQGYDEGMKEAMAGQQTGGVPDELLEQMANMSDEELAQFLQENPEVASAI